MIETKEKQAKPVYSRHERQALKQRLIKIQPVLEGIDYIALVCRICPEYDTPTERTRVRNVKNCVAADETITCILEKVAEESQIMEGRLKAMITECPNCGAPGFINGFCAHCEGRYED